MKKSDKTSELFAVVVELADEFSGELDLVPPSQRADVESIPVAATIAFSRALDFEDRGEIDEAIEQYEEALSIYEKPPRCTTRAGTSERDIDMGRLVSNLREFGPALLFAGLLFGPSALHGQAIAFEGDLPG